MVESGTPVSTRSSLICPRGFRYAVEIRNPEYLTTGYLDLLKSRKVAHVFNAWTRMPVLDEQAQIPRP